MAQLAENRYGKHKVRLVKLTRHDGVNTVREWSVNVLIQGDYDNCFRTGSNADILPTDTMKNTVYSLARRSSATCIEDFARELISHFLTSYRQSQSVGINVAERGWDHLEFKGQPHPTAFQQSTSELQTTSVSGSRDAEAIVTSGLSGLVILKTADSAFEGYIKDPLTTLRETTDRLFGTDVTASWTYDRDSLSFAQLRLEVRAALLAAFADHKSLSVQHTLFAMAEAALAQVPSLSDITLTMPNKHCFLIDLSPFGQDNPNEIFVPTEEPHGYIEARVTRESR
jgi:urate oxidase